METPSVRVLVVGDSGVGKTTLLQGVCRDAAAADGDGAPRPPHRWTIGCDVHVLLHQSRDASGGGGFGAPRETFIEFIDVGGHPKYRLSRGMFYHDVHGLILVHDLTNAKSHDHLRKWMREINETQRRKGSVLGAATLDGYSHASDAPPTLHEMPKLIVGNKRDQVPLHARRPMMSSSSVVADLRNVESMETSAEPLAVDPTVFYGFLDRVVAFASRSGHNGFINGDSATTTSNIDGMSDYSAFGPFSDGLRQTKNKLGAVSPTASSASVGGSVADRRARGWWR